MATGGTQLRIVLLGKTGTGKSSLGNKLLDDNTAFEIQRGLKSRTKACKWAKRQRGNLSVEVIDTPGLSDTRDVVKERVPIEVGKSVAFAAPGPHIILLVLRCDWRFTEEEYNVYEDLKRIFGQEICRYLIIVFNGMGSAKDKKDIDYQRKLLLKDLEQQPPDLHQLMTEANHRYYGVSEYLPEAQEKKQMDDLFTKMLDLLQKNNNQFYDGELCRRVDAVKEGWIHRYMETNHCSEEKATEAFNQAMDKEQPGIMASVVNAIAAFFRRVGARCSVM